MRPHKQQSNYTARFLSHALDSRFSKDVSRELCTGSLKVNNLQKDGKHATHNGSRATRAPTLAFEFRGLERALLPPPAITPTSYPGLAADSGSSTLRLRPVRAARSLGSAYTQTNALFTNPAGDITPLLETSSPSFPMMLRSCDDCTNYPERLDLDRHGLESCPLVEGGERLYLFNLQHNLISHIRNLSHLRCLVILDMYDNRLVEMSGISALTCLRVLILGKNRIKKIHGLDNLTRLDVLDLHGNQITQIENVSHLSELRVLNLAGNYIARVDNLQGLHSLSELNLRQNCISAVMEVDRLPCLQRLFLSHNRITSFRDLGCLSQSCSLSELTLDGNPLTQEACYKQTVLSCMLHLRQLDMKRVTDEDRRLACFLSRKDEERKRETQKLAVQKEKRRLAIRNAARYWENLKTSTERHLWNWTPEVSPEEGSSVQPVSLRQQQSSEELRQPNIGGVFERAQRNTSKLHVPSSLSSPGGVRSLETTGATVQILSLSDRHLAELGADTLCLFGPGALVALDQTWGAQVSETVTTIAFRYIPFNVIAPTLPRVRVKFPNLSHLIFLETDISRLPQLAALAQLEHLDQLTVHPEGNPVLSVSLWRPFLIYRLHQLNLQKVNGLEVTLDDMVSAVRLFGSLGYVAATETPHCHLLLLEEPRKHQVQFLLERRGQKTRLGSEEVHEAAKLIGKSLGRALLCYPCQDTPAEGTEEGAVESGEKTAVAKQYLHELVRQVSETSLKGESLQRLWPSLLMEMVRDCVLKMREPATYQHTYLSRFSPSQ